jgi:poly(A) polymerase
MKWSKLKPVLAHPGIGELLALHRADALASAKSLDHVDYCEQLLREWTAEDLTPRPVLTGEDLIRLGLKPGPLFKELLDAVHEGQLDGAITTTNQALELIIERLRTLGYCQTPEGNWQHPAGGGSW